MGLILGETRWGRRRARFWIGPALLVLVVSGSAWADPSFDFGALRGRLEASGFTLAQTHAALAALERADARGLPAQALANRIREGLARRAEPSAILGVLSARLADLERADDLARRCAREGITVRDRERSLLRLADSLSMGVTPADVAAVVPAAARASRSLEDVSRAAEVMGRLGGKGFPPADTREVLAAATAAGWTRGQMDGLVSVFLEAQRLEVARDKTRQMLVDGIREQKEPANLVDDVRRSASSSDRPSSDTAGSGPAKGGKGADTSRGSGSGARGAAPHPTGPRPHPHR